MRFGIRSVVWLGAAAMGFATGPLAAQQGPPQAVHPIVGAPGPPPPRTASAGNAPPAGPALVFDAETKEYDAGAGEEVAPFTFNLTNVWTNQIIIDSVRASCGCTTASLPATPWHIPPGGGGQVRAQVRLAGKMGLIAKTLTFWTSVGTRVVTLKVNIPPPPAASGVLSPDQRRAAMAKAAADPQAIFKGDCAQCHADKGRDALGEDLYAADCGICHESSRRNSLVPDLHALKRPTDFEYWKAIMILGKPRTMMPAFASAQGGPLSQAQILSLASYLNRTISHNFFPTLTGPPDGPLLPAASGRP